MPLLYHGQGPWLKNFNINSMTKSNIAIIGAGKWGSALALSLADKYKIQLYCYNKQELDNANNLVKENINPTLDIKVISKCKVILIVVSSDVFCNTLDKIAPHITASSKIAWATKGFDTINKQLMHQTFERKLPNYIATLISGPSFADEVVKKKLTTLVVSSKDNDNNKYWANIIKTKYIRAYTNNDIIGAQIGGAVKNILAIASGIIAGLKYGANTQAALITRGLAEITRFGIVLGAKQETFMGLTGIGDLVLTCSDDLSRNRSFGKNLVKYKNIKTAIKNTNGIIEGLNALNITLKLAKDNNIELPICQQIYMIINNNITPQQAIDELMTREQTDEW